MALVTHVLLAAVVVNSKSVLHLGRPCAHHCADSTNEVAVQVVLRRPPSLPWAHLHVFVPIKLRKVMEVALLGRELLKVLPRSMLHRGLDAISPRSLVLGLCECERRAR